MYLHQIHLGRCFSLNSCLLQFFSLNWWLLGFRFLFPAHSPFHRIDKIRSQVRRRNNVIQRAYGEGPLHAVHAVKLGGHLTQFLGVYDFKEFFPLGAQPPFFRALGFGHRPSQFLETRLFAGSGAAFPAKTTAAAGAPPMTEAYVPSKAVTSRFSFSALEKTDRKSTRLNSSHRCISYAV